MSVATYQFRLEEPLEAEAIRIFRSQVNRARRELKQPSDHAIHSARKAIKRARAFLRLFQGFLSQPRFDALDDDLRSVGRDLAPVRDCAVALAILERLAGEDALGKAVEEPLRVYVEAKHSTATIELVANDQVEELRSKLKIMRLRPEELVGFSARSFHYGLARTYSRGRERLALAVEHHSVEALHAWRRQVKHLGYQIRLLSPAWPVVLRPTARAFDTLSEALGDDHDLAELVSLATEANLSADALRAVQRVARKRRKVLQKMAWPLGARIYAEAAGPFAERLTVYLAAALAEEQGEPLQPLDGMALAAPVNGPHKPVLTIS